MMKVCNFFFNLLQYDTVHHKTHDTFILAWFNNKLITIKQQQQQINNNDFSWMRLFLNARSSHLIHVAHGIDNNQSV